MTRLEEWARIEKLAKQEAESEGEQYKIESPEKVIKEYCPGSFFDYCPSIYPLNKTNKKCNQVRGQRNCEACWNEEYQEMVIKNAV